MKRKTHLIVGSAMTLPVVSLIGAISPIYVIITFLGTIAPDFDSDFGLKHRGASHSLVAATLTGIVFSALLGVKVGLIWTVAYCSHLFLDSLTKMGVPFLYPINKKRFGIRKFKTNGLMDNWVILVGLGVAVLVVLEIVVNGVLSFIR